MKSYIAVWFELTFSKKFRKIISLIIRTITAYRDNEDRNHL
jgi:hypothetical protein